MNVGLPIAHTAAQWGAGLGVVSAVGDVYLGNSFRDVLISAVIVGVCGFYARATWCVLAMSHGKGIAATGAVVSLFFGILGNEQANEEANKGHPNARRSIKWLNAPFLASCAWVAYKNRATLFAQT